MITSEQLDIRCNSFNCLIHFKLVYDDNDDDDDVDETWKVSAQRF